MPIGKTESLFSPAAKYISLWQIRHMFRGRTHVLRKHEMFPQIMGPSPRVRPRPAYLLVSVVAVTNLGRMSFGTVFILSSAFCTSGRMTTYFVIISLARA